MYGNTTHVQAYDCMRQVRSDKENYQKTEQVPVQKKASVFNSYCDLQKSLEYFFFNFCLGNEIKTKLRFQGEVNIFLFYHLIRSKGLIS